MFFTNSQNKSRKNDMDNQGITTLLLIILIILMIIFGILMLKKKKQSLHIKNKMVKEKYESLVSVLGKPTYLEKDHNDNMNSATWMSPLDNFQGFGKYGGADLIKILGEPSKKYHPHPAKLFIVLGKYMQVPDNLIGPLKYASETINIEQLLVPKSYSEHYYNTGEKQIALVSGSCASVAISAITVQFAIDMINKYKDNNRFDLERAVYQEFRDEYDRRIDDYLCGRGITNEIPWFSHQYFEEGATANLGPERCEPTKEGFSHYPECENLMKDDNFCKENPDHKCC